MIEKKSFFFFETFLSTVKVSGKLDDTIIDLPTEAIRTDLV